MQIKVVITIILLAAILSSCSSGTQYASPSPGIPSASPSNAASPSVTPSPTPAASPALPPSQSTSPPTTHLPSAAPSRPPITTEYKDVYIPFELPLSKKNDDGTETLLYISVDEENFVYHNDYIEETALVSADFDGDGDNEVLTIEVTSDFKESEYNNYNHPIQIKMIIGDSVKEFESTWNDGIRLYVTDFNFHDNYKDIFLFSSGTDIDGYFNIYRCDGRNITYYTGHHAQSPSFSFDGNGKIYFADYLEGYYNDDPEEFTYHAGQVITVLDYDNIEFYRYNSES